jgi:hypothetical protein
VNPAGKPIACRQEFIPETQTKHKNQCQVLCVMCYVLCFTISFLFTGHRSLTT